MARVRTYGGITEALAEWRRLGVPEGTFGRSDLTSKRFIFLDDIVRNDALALVQEVKVRGGQGCLCKGDRALIAITPVVLEAMLMGGATPEKVQEMTLAWKRRDQEEAPVFEWSGGSMDLSRPRIMGILNVTPDSFSDGGKHFDVEAAVARAEQMRSEGADLIDVGGESTRPGASVVPADEEWARISKVIARVSEEVGLPVSVDTRRPEVARKALRAGASLVNDVSGLGEEMTTVVRDAGAGAFIMHMRGEPANMQSDTQYVDVVGDTYAFLEKHVEQAVRKGVRWESLAVDPGLGFGKDLKGNLQIMRRLDEYRSLGRPVLLGASRKSFVARVLDGESTDRLEGSLASAAVACWQGVRLFRVHDIKETVRTVKMVHSIMEGR